MKGAVLGMVMNDLACARQHKLPLCISFMGAELASSELVSTLTDSVDAPAKC